MTVQEAERLSAMAWSKFSSKVGKTKASYLVNALSPA
jgi:hypothetical protein